MQFLEPGWVEAYVYCSDTVADGDDGKLRCWGTVAQISDDMRANISLSIPTTSQRTLAM
jgi:hypothetical protein